MFYLMMIPVCCFLLWQYRWLKQIEKHDRHLYQFCQLRREAMALLMDEYDSMDQQDLAALRQVIDALNSMIHHYRTHKTVLFDFRRFVKHVQTLQQFEQQQQSVHAESPQVQALMHRMAVEVCQAFLAYTPFLRHELIVRISVMLIGAAVSIGIAPLKKLLVAINQGHAAVKQLQVVNSPYCPA